MAQRLAVQDPVFKSPAVNVLAQRLVLEEILAPDDCPEAHVPEDKVFIGEILGSAADEDGPESVVRKQLGEGSRMPRLLLDHEIRVAVEDDGKPLERRGSRREYVGKRGGDDVGPAEEPGRVFGLDLRVETLKGIERHRLGRDQYDA